MSYRQLVEPHHKLTFRNNIKMTAQQMSNPLRAAVTTVTCTGEAQDMADLINEIDYLRGEDYGRRNPENPPKRSRRWLVRPGVIESGQYITKEEKFDQSQDPSSQLITAHLKAVERGVFDTILGIEKAPNGEYRLYGGGILGPVYEGKTPTSTVSLPAANYIASDFDVGGTHTGLTTGKLRGATEGMELEDFGLETDEEVYGLITPKQKTDLINLAIETKTSLNPFEVENIREGKPGKLLGINWLFTNRLPKDPNGYRLCPIWLKSEIVCGFWQDVEGDMWNDTAAKNLPYAHVDCYPAAGRVQDGGVRVIRCAE